MATMLAVNGDVRPDKSLEHTVSYTSAKKLFLPKYSSSPQFKTMTGAKTMPVHFKLSFFCLLFRKNEDKSEEGLAHDD